MQRRVLVVVEEPLGGQIATALRSAGHTPFLASDEATAITHAQEHHCEIALVEIALPRRNGYRLASTLRPRMAKPPLLIGIAAAIAPPPPESLDCGIACVFVRPIEIPELLVLIDRWNPAR